MANEQEEEEPFTPNASALHHNTRNRFKSPPPPSTAPTFMLGSNNDQLERAQARAARAAAVRHKTLAVNLHPDHQLPDSNPCLHKQQILDLFHNCIKLASENKINQKNTWELDLIDHLTDIFRVEDNNNVETNFQMASCTLEAGVKIYSLRVDSVHAKAYKVLAGMVRAGQETEQDATLEDSANVESGKEDSKKSTKKLSPLSTLESSFEVLNAKKFDAAFAVDPLYRQTTAQFDEGGVKGLLMNNLGVYGGCRVLFDSQEVPGKSMAARQNEHHNSDTIDLSFARDCVEQLAVDMQAKNEISPTLGVIVNQFDESNRRPSDFQFSDPNSAEEYDVSTDCEIGGEREEYKNCPPWDDNLGYQTFVDGSDSNYADPSFPSYPQEKELFPLQDPDTGDQFEDIDGYLLLSLGLRSKKNAWAGPDHWKYQKAKGSEEVRCTYEDGLSIKTKLPRTKGQNNSNLDFSSFLEQKMADIFSPPKNPKLLLLPENQLPCNTKLPEDCHYEPMNLVKLFLLPNIKCLGRRARKFSGVAADESRVECDDYESFPSWDDDNKSVCDGEHEGDVQSDMDDSNTLISQPRQVNKIGVQYEKTSKQVDVQALKTTLWHHIQEYAQLPDKVEKETVSFRHILVEFPSESNAAATVNDISPHLCFICLLHLANEKGLSIQSCPNLDDLSVCLPDDGAAKVGTA